jgi:8-oxo-dGTP diphosphatase
MDTLKGTSIIFVRLDNEEPEVLLFLRDNIDTIPYPNCWDIPGGHVEINETPEECIVREMMEEIGIDIGTPELFRIYKIKDRTEYTYWQAAIFDIDDIQLNEGQALRWFSEKEIRDMRDEDFSFGFRQVIFDFFHDHVFIK